MALIKTGHGLQHRWKKVRNRPNLAIRLVPFYHHLASSSLSSSHLLLLLLLLLLHLLLLLLFRKIVRVFYQPQGSFTCLCSADSIVWIEFTQMLLNYASIPRIGLGNPCSLLFFCRLEWLVKPRRSGFPHLCHSMNAT